MIHPIEAPHVAGMEERSEGRFVLHSDYARLQGLAREFAEAICDDYIIMANNYEIIDSCLKCGVMAIKGKLNHPDCIVGKCEAFLAGGI